MATIIPLWNTSGMTGRADKTSDVYIRHCRITAPDASPEDKAVLEKLQRMLRRQSKYSMVRGLVVAKYASVNDTLDTVTVTIDRYEATVHSTFNARPLQ